MIRTIIFDFDDTLVEERPMAERTIEEVCKMATRRYGMDSALLRDSVFAEARILWYAFEAHPYCKRVGISSWEGLWSRFGGDAPELEMLRDWAPSYRRGAWFNAMRAHGAVNPNLAVEMAEAFFVERRKKHRVFPEASRVLDQLMPEYKLGLLTNGASDLQREKISGSGLADCFEYIVVSGELGMRKPAPEVFLHVLDKLDTCADNAVMIGDSLESDIAGARAAGIRSVWVNRDSRPVGDGAKPDFTVRSLDEVPDLLARLNGDISV